MWPAVGQILTNAVGVALPPMPIIALVLLLLSAHARRDAGAFVAGTVGALAALSALVLVLGIGAADDDGAESSAAGVIKLVLGGLLLALAARQFGSRPREGVETPAPKWMAQIDKLGPLRAFGLGVLLVVANPIKIGMVISAMTTIDAAQLPSGQQWTVVAIFVFIGCATFIIPYLFVVAAGERAAAPLASTKTWLMANNAVIMSVLFLVLGTKIIGDALTILAA